MSTLNFEVKITAIGEVRDKDGNLLSATPVEFDPITMTEQQLRDFQGDVK
jgi:hypothetical protein